MNMISTGAFLNEMDASNKQETFSEKFVRVWEKKNAKAARAGGVSLMALSLAACGGSSSTTTTTTTTDTTTTDTTTTDTTTTTTTPTVTAKTLELTKNGDTITSTDTTTAGDTITGTATTYNDGDAIVEGNSADGDTLNVSSTASITATPTVAGIENINFNFTSFTNLTAAVDDITGGIITANNLQAGGATGATLTGLGSNLTAAAGSGVTGTFTVDLASTATGSTVDGNNAGTISVVDAGSTGVTIISDKTGTTASTVAITLEGDGDTSTAGTANDTATIKAIGEVDLETASNNQVENLVLEGNGAAVTFNLNATGDAVENVTMQGSQSVTFVATAVQVADEVFTDNTTAGTTTLEIGTSTAATHDVSSAAVDVIEFTTNTTGGYTFTFATGATAKISADMTANGNMTLQADATSGDETLNLIAKSGTGTNDLILTDLEIVNLTVDDGKATAATISLEDVTAANTTLNVSGSDNLTLAGSHEIKKINAANMTGVLTTTLSAASDDVVGGAGNDVITLADVNFTLDGGAGTDTLTSDGNVDLSNNTVSMTGMDVLQIDSADNGSDTVTLLSSDITGQTIVIKGNNHTDNSINDTLAIKADGTTIDLGNLVVNNSSAAATDTAAKVTIDLTSVAALGTNITGTNGEDTTSNAGNGAVTINAGAGNDTITTAGGADVITAGEGADVITAGDGDDTIDLTETTSAIDTVHFSATAANGKDTITGFVKAKDILNVEKLAGGNVAAEAAVAANAAKADIASATAIVFADGADGTGTEAIADYTDLADVAAFIDAGITAAASETFAIVINDVANNKAYVYNATDAGDGGIESNELTLHAIISVDAALTTANTDFTA